MTDALRRLIGAPTESESIRNSLQALLTTLPGQRRSRPEYGCDISSLLFEPVESDLLEEMLRRIRNAIWRYERRIELIDVRARAQDPGIGSVLVKIDYSVRSSGERAQLAVQIHGFG
ncbi:MAG TPA: GPW/gp25 family protein [Allosphingosinicella sp.]